MNTIKFCLKCGHPIGPEEKFCMGCGANVAEMQAQQGGANVGGQPQQAAPQPQAAPQQQATAFQQPNTGFNQQANNFQQPQFAQPNSGFGTPGAAVKPAGDNWFKKNLKLIIIIACALVVLIAGFFIIKHIFFRFQKIDAKELYKFDFKGIETSGVATAKLNKYSDSQYSLGSAVDALSDYTGLDYDDDDDDDDSDDSENAKSPYFEISEKKLLEAWTKASDKKEAQKMRDALLSSNAELKITLNGEESAKGLSNGDKVKCVVTCNDKYLEDNNIKLTNKEFEVEVEGLKNGTKIDLFENITVTFTGNDGSGRVEYDRSNAPSFVRCSFKEDYRNLKNGDKVILTARMRSAVPVDAKDPEGAVTLEYDGNYYICEKAVMEKEYTVEGLKEMKKIDVFEGVKLKYRDAIPYLRVTGVDNEGCSEEVKTGVRFYVDDTSKLLKKGDTVKIKAYPRSSFTSQGYAIDGTPDEDGYYVKEFTIGDDAPTFITKDTAAANASKFNAEFEKVIKEVTEKGVDRTYASGFSAGAKIKSMSFKEVKTYVLENSEASTYSDKCYIGKQYVVTVVTEKETKTAYGLILLRNPKIAGDEVTVDENYQANLYSKEESVKSALDSLNRKFSVNEVTASAAPAPSTDSSSKADESSKAEESKAA